MRWIFISLAFINLCLFAWGMVVTSKATDDTSTAQRGYPFASYPQLALLSEVSSASSSTEVQKIERIAGQPSSSPTVADDPGPERQFCELVGPFADTEIANNFIERLRAIDIVSRVQELELPAGHGYWVYLRPQPTRREALRLLSELHAKKIDSYVIPKGEIENGISLGMFSQKSSAETRVKEMKAIGLAPLVDEIERTYREIWVMLDPGEGAKISNLTWQRVMEGINDLERRQNYCLDVAS